MIAPVSCLDPRLASRWSLPLGWSLLVLALLAAPAAAQLPVAELQSIYPPGCQQGQSVEVTLTGDNLEEITKLQFSHPGITAQPVMGPGKPWQKDPVPVPNKFTVQVAADVPPGLYEVRTVGFFGLSTPRAFEVGQLPDVREEEPNNTPEQATVITVNSIANGQIDAKNYDYFTFEAEGGQRVLIDCWSQRLDSAADATLTVFGPDGRQLASDNDTYRLDPFIDLAIPATGTYIVEVSDLTYTGGANHGYRLHVHTKPHIDFAMPPAGVPGSKTTVTLYGRNLPGSQPAPEMTIDGQTLEKVQVQIDIPAEPRDRQLVRNTLVRPEDTAVDGFEYRMDTPAGLSNPVRIGFSDRPMILENNDNNTPATAMKIDLPVELAGQFYPRGDQDWFTFEAKAGETYWVDVISQRRGQSTDPFVLVQQVTVKDDGEEQVRDLTTLDDTKHPANRGSFDLSTDDPRFEFKVPADGTYRILVRDLYGGSRGDPRFIYRLAIRPAQPDFRLVAVPRHPQDNGNTYNVSMPLLRRGGTAWLDVIVDRQDGFDGAIELRVEGLPQGVTVSPAILGKNDSSTTLVFSATEDAPDWAGSISILGTAQLGDQKLERAARGGTIVWRSQQNSTVGYARMTRDIGLGVTGTEVAPFKVELDNSKVHETARAGKLEIPVMVIRRNEYKEDIQLQAVGLSGDFQPKNFTIKGGDTTGKLELNLKNNAPTGRFTFYLQATGKYQYERNPASITRAEEQQKAAEEYLKQMTEAEKAANTAKSEADKQVAEAEKAAKEAADQVKKLQDELAKAEQKDELTKQVAEAEKAKTTADEALTKARAAQQQADQAAKDAAEAKKQADQLKKDADKEVQDAKNRAKANNVNLMEASTAAILKVDEAPMNLSATMPPMLKQGEKITIPVKLERLYGFDDEVSLDLKLSNVSGLKIDKPKVEKGKDEATITIEAAENATPGEHTVTLEANLKFNNQNLKVEQPLTLVIQAVKKES